MKLSVIIPVHNAFEVSIECLDLLTKNSVSNPEILFIDNGSTPMPFAPAWDSAANVKVRRNEENTGVWATFKQGFDAATGDVLAYLHSDLMVHEHGWDQRLLEAFEQDEKLGLVGFVGSNEWSWDGGRGGGTTSNFQGIGRGSPAEAHGRRNPGLTAALQVDGCAMVLRRSAMEQLGFFDWPPHHFYDRIYSLRMLKAGWHVGVLGVACDHISGQTANTQEGWQRTAQKWCNAHGIMEKTAHNWDYTVYNVAEQRFLTELHEYMGPRRHIRCDANHNVL